MGRKLEVGAWRAPKFLIPHNLILNEDYNINIQSEECGRTASFFAAFLSFLSSSVRSMTKSEADRPTLALAPSLVI